jgi:hypothetical protein
VQENFFVEGEAGWWLVVVGLFGRIDFMVRVVVQPLTH